MQKKPKLSLIDNYNDLLITKNVLLRNVEDIENGKRFDHLPEGHDHYVGTIYSSLKIVEDRLELLKK